MQEKKYKLFLQVVSYFSEGSQHGTLLGTIIHLKLFNDQGVKNSKLPKHKSA